MSAHDSRLNKDHIGLNQISQTLSNQRAKHQPVGKKYLKNIDLYV